VGMGRMLGFSFPRNFDHPYAARSVTDFWRRWHITLSQWFRDYVYIPLGGSRRGRARTFLNLLAVWLLTGLWHGADWAFLLWGLWYFIWLSLERLWSGRLPGAAARPLTILIVMLGWAIFKSGSVFQLGRTFSDLFCLRSGGAALYHLENSLFPLIAALCLCVPAIHRLLRRVYARSPLLSAVGLMALLLLCVSALAGESYNPFLYFRF